MRLMEGDRVQLLSLDEIDLLPTTGMHPISLGMVKHLGREGIVARSTHPEATGFYLVGCMGLFDVAWITSRKRTEHKDIRLIRQRVG